MHQARRMAHIQPFHVMALLARARELEAQGRSIVHMEIGEPDFPTPAPIVAAGQQALAAGATRYTPALGLPALREAISDYYRERHGVAVDPGRIVVTPGASGALHLVLALLVDRDQQVLLTDPGYPCNRNFVRLVEGEPVAVPVDAATGYQMTAALAEQHWSGRTRVVLVASPANPTGTLLSQAELAALQQLCRDREAMLVVDEIYHGLTYDAAATTALSVGDSLFVINSFSKFFGMTGWRLGWIVAPPDQVEGLDRLAQNLFLAAPTLSQHAALAAFAPDTMAILEERRAAFQARRDYLLPALRELGFVIPVTPQGAFYLYADCSRFTDDSFVFSRRLLEEAGVAITPGLDFGGHRASQHVRFAYTTDLEKLQEGVERIRRFVAG
jgi:aspartate/methionine/tyrosine aminotransferase